MKKILLALAAVLVSFSSYAIDYYLIGGFNGWTLKQTNCKFTDQGNGTFVLDYNGTLTSGFKINDGTWSNEAANFGGSATLKIGETYNLTVGGSSGNISLSENITNPHLVLNPTAKTLIITGQATAVEYTYGIHSNWFDTNWSTVNMTEQNGKWVLANQTVPAGTFGIKQMDKSTGSQTDWISAAGSSVVVLDTPMACKVEGTDFSNAAGTYTLTFDPKAMTLTVTGTQTGEDVKPDYSSWWVNLGGTFNDNDFFTEPSAQPVDGIASFSNIAIGNGTIKVKTWDNNTDKYYITENQTIAQNEWVQMVEDGYDVYCTIDGATEGETFNIKFNVETNQIFVESNGSGPVTPPIPGHTDILYLMGDVNGYAWATNKGIEATDNDGIYTWNNVIVNPNNGNYGYINIGSALGSSWDVVNAADRYGAVVNDTQVEDGGTYDVVLYNGGGNAETCASWMVEAGTYNFTLDLNEMKFSVTTLSVDDPVTPPTPDPTLPDVVYLMGNVNEGNWAPDYGVEAEGNEGVFEWKNIAISDEYNGNGYFSFSTKLGADWDADGPNTSNRYGAVASDTPVQSGGNYEVVLYAVGVDASSCAAWMAPAGTYDFTLDLVNNTLKVEEAAQTDGVGSINVENGAAVYYNLQGVKVQNPENGLYIKIVDGKAVKVLVRK